MESNEIEKQIFELRKKKEAADRKAWLANLPEHKKIIGKCYRYRNSYGSGSKSWWLYGKVTGVKRGTASIADVWAVMNQFQKCSHGRIEFKKTEWCNRVSDGWIEITKAQYEKERKKLIFEIQHKF